MSYNLTIVIPSYDTELEVQSKIISVKKRLAFLESPTCRDMMPQEMRLTEIKGATVLFKSLLVERDNLQKGGDLYG